MIGLSAYFKSVVATQMMEAYEFRQNFETMTTAATDKHSADFEPYGNWLLETGGGASVPIDWLQHWPSRGSVMPCSRQPTAWISAGGYCVVPEVKAVIESLLPNIHQFIPVLIEAGPHSDRKLYSYFSLHIADRADDVLIDKSEGKWNQNLYDKNKKFWTKRRDRPVVLPETSIKGKHLWWNKRCMMSLMSGELKAELEVRDLLSGLEFQKQIIE